MWLFNTGRPWDLPGNVFYVKDAKLTRSSTRATSIRAVQKLRLDDERRRRGHDAGVLGRRGLH